MRSDIKELLEPRQPYYKMVKISRPHCPICKEMLGGNNSGISPWKCSCGEWTKEILDDYYKIKVKPL